MTNYWLLLLPCWLCVVLLAAILVIREHQAAKIQKALIDRILTKEGLEPLPEIHPIDDLVGNEPRKDVSERLAEAVQEIARKKRSAAIINHRIPGMMPKAGMGEIK